jgi:hypothetical protein
VVGTVARMPAQQHKHKVVLRRMEGDMVTPVSHVSLAEALTCR